MKSFGRLGVAPPRNHPPPVSQPPAPVASDAPVASEAIPREERERENERTEGSQVAQETPQQENEVAQATRKPKRRN